MNYITLKHELKAELEDRLLPFWTKLKDEENGGFYGRVDFTGQVDKRAEKGCILNSRILWFFSSAYMCTKNPAALDCAKHAYRFLTENFLDKEKGGLYWSADYKGRPENDLKHVYNLAFGIYGLSLYHRAAKDRKALELALGFYGLIEEKCRDENGYLEEFDRSWHKTENTMLGGQGLSERTMNTTLHLMEAYTALYEVSGDGRVKKSLKCLLNVVKERLYNPQKRALRVFFDPDWHAIPDIRSYGHDIEASWLIDRASQALGEQPLPLTLEIADEVYRTAYSSDGVDNETISGVTDRHRVWWVQAESAVGFFNAYIKTRERRYLDAAFSVWDYIRDNVCDSSTGEWFSELDESGGALSLPVVSEWKCPYHNGRMCMEIIRMIDCIGGSPFERRYSFEKERHDALIKRKNRISDEYNGIFYRYERPVLTRNHVPLSWRFDLNRKTNPFFMERAGVNAVFNPGAIEYGGKFCLVARIEGSDRKSFFGVAESENGVDGFRFRDYPIMLPDAEEPETDVYDMRLTRHEDGWIYGVYCAENKDPTAEEGDLSSAVAKAAIVRTHDLEHWERLPYLVTPSPQQRNVVLHPEFVNGRYCFYTRPMDGFIGPGSGSGICVGYCGDIAHPVIEEEKVLSQRRYHTITECKNGEGTVPIKTPRGWIHIAHGVRNTAAGLRYVIYLYVTALDDVEKVIAEPDGYLLAPFGDERVGDVSNVVFSNGAVVKEGDVYLYYASSDTRIHVATSTVDRLLDYAFNTPADPFYSNDCVRRRIALIKGNQEEV